MNTETTKPTLPDRLRLAAQEGGAVSTPETDTEILRIECDDSCCDVLIYTQDGTVHPDDAVSVNFARQLELERNAWRDCARQLESALRHSKDYMNAPANVFKAVYDALETFNSLNK